ncbi:MAG TPA: PASTA domain-containing protein [Pyrinomonadaceae bacterium]|jgi:beta-lactam-binding protein with PASTA domain
MVAKRALSALSKIGIIIAIAVAFLFGMAGTVYLSLRSPEVRVPDLKGKDRMAAEAALDDAGLNMKVRATRFSPDAKPDTILDQLPEKDDVIKVGQTVAVVVARGPKEGESAATAAAGGGGGSGGEDKKPEAGKASENQNANGNTAAANQNENKPKRTKNANNKNANNSNNSNNGNANRNANNRNSGNGNANTRNANAGNRNADANRNTGTTNANRRAPVISTPSTPPLVPSGPPRLR